MRWGAFLRAGAARDRHRPGLRPYHLGDRRGHSGLGRGFLPLLCDAQGASGTAGAGGCQAGDNSFKDSRARRRYCQGQARGRRARPGDVESALRFRLGQAVQTFPRPGQSALPAREGPGEKSGPEGRILHYVRSGLLLNAPLPDAGKESSGMIRRVLTIAGSDPGGGAGLQADLKTFCAFGVYGMSVVTAGTVQNTLGVRSVNPVAPRLAAAQAEAVLADIGADAVKIGMLATPGIVKAAAGCLKKYAVKNIVLDPVLRAKDGRALLSPDAEVALKKLLLPLALVVTPNAPEAARLAGVRVKNFSEARRAAKIISGLGPRFGLVRGGHIAGRF